MNYGSLGTWLYNFATNSWTQISAAVSPEHLVAWGPYLVWEGIDFGTRGTWIYDGAAWTEIATGDAVHVEVLGPDLLWSGASGTWVWGGGGGGAGWTQITPSVATQIVSTGAIK